MYTKKLIFLSILFILFSQILFCVSYRYNVFGTGGKGFQYSNYFSLNELGFGVKIKSNVKNEHDSVYNVALLVFEERECDSANIDFFNKLKIENLNFQFNEFNATLDLQKVDRINDCKINYYFEDIIIPNSLDTIFLQLKISYFIGDQINIIDSTISLYKYEGIHKDLISF